MSKVYTIIVTYNACRNNWIRQCLDCLLISKTPMTIVVVDNASSDNTAETIIQEYSMVTLLQQNRNLGFGQANNIGIRYALEHHADYILLLNQDAYLQSWSLSEMLLHADGTHLMTPLHLNGKGNTIDKVFGITLSNAQLPTDQLQLTDDIYNVADTPAACWLIPRVVIEKVGGFNPLFFQYGEDNNYYRRLVFHGLKDIILVSKAEVWHDRNLHGNMQIFMSGLLHRDILLCATDITLNKWRRSKQYMYILYKCYRDRKERNYPVGAFFREIMWLLSHYNDIRTSRQTEEQQGYTWL